MLIQAFFVYRLLGTKAHRQVNTMSVMHSINNSINHVNVKTQHEMNMMGDAFCSETANNILDNICKDENEDILSIKHGVESLYTGKMANATPRARIRKATLEGINGFTFCPDNVGFVGSNQCPLGKGIFADGGGPLQSREHQRQPLRPQQHDGVGGEQSVKCGSQVSSLMSLVSRFYQSHSTYFCSDEPLCKPSDVGYFITEAGIAKLTAWKKVMKLVNVM